MMSRPLTPLAFGTAIAILLVVQQIYHRDEVWRISRYSRMSEDTTSTSSGSRFLKEVAESTSSVQLNAIKLDENCNSNRTRCKYFDPIRFVRKTWFDWMHLVNSHAEEEKIQYGKLFDIDQMCRNGEKDFVDLLTMKCLNTSSDGKYCIPPRNEKYNRDVFQRLPKEWTYKHTQKTGGHSVDFAMLALSYNEVPMYEMGHFQNGRDLDVIEAGENHTSKIEVEQRQNGPGSHPLFALVRDPVERFVSGSAQALKDDPKLRKRCGDEGSDMGTETLRCILEEVEQGYDFITLVPMVVDLYCSARGHSMKISIYNFDEDLRELLKALGDVDSGEKKHNARKGLSTADLDDYMLFRICRLYIADVKMMRSLGYDVPGCPACMYERHT